jgi:hypothetical protein
MIAEEDEDNREVLVYGTVREDSEENNSSLDTGTLVDIASDSVSSITYTIHIDDSMAHSVVHSVADSMAHYVADSVADSVAHSVADSVDLPDEGVPLTFVEEDLTKRGYSFWRDLKKHHDWQEMRGRPLDINYLYVAPKHKNWNRARVVLQLQGIRFENLAAADIFIFTSEQQVAAYVRDVLQRRERGRRRRRH